MKLDGEVRHKSEDIDDAMLPDVVQAIRRRVRIVSREHDIGSAMVMVFSFSARSAQAEE
jgi:hypothetical protein